MYLKYVFFKMIIWKTIEFYLFKYSFQRVVKKDQTFWIFFYSQYMFIDIYNNIVLHDNSVLEKYTLLYRFDYFLNYVYTNPCRIFKCFWKYFFKINSLHNNEIQYWTFMYWKCQYNIQLWKNKKCIWCQKS